MRIKFQISLKWFLLATTAAAVLVGMLGKPLYEWWHTDFALQRRTRAIAELEEFGVKLERRDQNIFKVSFPDGQIPARYFQLADEIEEFEELRLDRTGFADADAPTLLAHPKLHELRLSFNPGVTDKALKYVAQIKSLQTLEICQTAITDEGLKELARLPRLQSLNLSSTKVTSRGLAHLRPLQSLLSLSIVNTCIDDSGVEEIGNLRNLRIVSLSRTQVHGSGLGHLAKLPNLIMLDLHGCSLQDGSGLAELKQVKSLRIWDAEISWGVLSHIHKMDNLRELELPGSTINDAHLAELANATQLTGLELGSHGYSYSHQRTNDLNSKISAAALKELREKLPNTRISGEPRDP